MSAHSQRETPPGGPSVRDFLREFAGYLKGARRFISPTALVCGAVFLGLLIISQSFLLTHLTERALHTSESVVHRDIAKPLAEKLRTFGEQADRGELARRIDELATLNPSVRLYLISNRGIVKYSPQSYGRAKLPFVTMTPVRNFFDPQFSGVVLYGDDPHEPNGRVPISAATVRIASEPHYLYVVTADARLKASFLKRAGLTLGLSTFIVAGLSTAIVLGVGSLLLYRRLRAVSTSLAVLSHDLRGPLTSIQGSLETIMSQKGGVHGAESERFMKVALKSSRSAASMLNDIHHLSKLEASQSEVAMEPIGLPDLLMDCVLAVKPQCEERKIDLSLNISPGLPRVVGNVELLERMVRNLLDNSIRYTPSKGRIDLTVSRVPNKVRVTILDTGVGIPASQLNRVSACFTRGENVKDSFQGSGIGLSVASEVARLHGGELRILSRQGEGTAVIFELPVAGLERMRATKGPLAA